MQRVLKILFELALAPMTILGEYVPTTSGVFLEQAASFKNWF